MAARTIASRALLLEPGAHWKHKMVMTAAKLDLFSFLAGGARDAAAVAAHYQGNVRAFELFLNALAGLRLLEKRQGLYRNSRFAARRLVRGRKDYRGDQLVIDDLFWGLWGELETALRTGRAPQSASIFRADPEAAQRLILGLHHDALKIAPDLAQRLPLEGCQALLDLGGGAGTYAIAFCQRYPGLRATVFDLPTVTGTTRSLIAQQGLQDRIQVVDGDFTTDPLPKDNDVVFMSNVLHSSGPDDNQRLLRKVSDVLNAGGRVIVRDVVMDADLASPPFGAVFAVYMLLHTPEGRCYAFDEIAGWLDQAGFGEIETLEPNAVLTARKKDR
ncbi:MAG: methyltransferase [Dehalococcoidia bacterium]